MLETIWKPTVRSCESFSGFRFRLSLSVWVIIQRLKWPKWLTETICHKPTKIVTTSSKMLISVAYFHTSLSCLYASIHVFPLLPSRFTHFHTHLWWYLRTNFSQVAWEIRGRIVIGHFSIIKRNGPAESSYVSKIQILISLHKQNYSLIGNYGIKMLFISLCFLHTLHKISNFIFTVLKNTLT